MPFLDDIYFMTTDWKPDCLLYKNFLFVNHQVLLENFIYTYQRNEHIPV